MLLRLLLLFGFCAAASAAQKPNVVVILADDLGYGSVGCYGAPTNLVRTPHCDRLAAEGRRFTDANTPSSVCSPTRYALLTGRYCWRTSLKHEVLGVFSPLHIETNRPTIASVLKKHGYRTATVGKWHLGYGSAAKTDYTAGLRPGPRDVGFDYDFAVPSNHGDITGVFVENSRVAGLRSNRLDPTRYGTSFYGRVFIGLDAPQREDTRVMETLTAKAVAWLEQQRADTPFFLYFTPVAVHHPITPSASRAGSSAAGPYGDFIRDLDDSVGAILGALDRMGVASNTLVVFTSDNGGVVADERKSGTDEWTAQQAGLKICGDWRGRKHSIYEGGFHVPFLARWPGHIPAGTVTGETIGLVDLFATLAAIVGEPMPERTVAAEDSVNVLPALLGQKTAAPLREALVVHSADGVFAIRQGPWKWIEGVSSKPKPPAGRRVEFTEQLYNLAKDPAETTDLLADEPAIAARLRTLLEDYRHNGFSRP